MSLCFDWAEINGGNCFDVIIGNPPYVNTEGMHTLLPNTEVEIYKKKYKTSHKQFDKYFIFIEQAINKIKDSRPAKRVATLLQKQKEILIQEIQELIEKVYQWNATM